MAVTMARRSQASRAPQGRLAIACEEQRHLDALKVLHVVALLFWLCAADGDDDLAADVPALEVAHGLGDLGEPVGTIDDGSDLAGLDELLEEEQALPAHGRQERADLLAPEA